MSNSTIRISMAALLVFFSITLSAQDEKKEEVFGWINNMVGSLNFAQSSFSNWQAGGENNWTGQLDLNAKAERNEPKYNWLSTVKFQYGIQDIENIGSRKTVDEVRLESVGIYKMNTYVNPYAALKAESQFSPGYSYTTDPVSNITFGTRVSRALNPAYLTESFGLGFEPLEKLKTRFGLAFKQTVTGVERFALVYSDDPETATIEKVRSEVGLESVTDFERKLMDNILFVTKIEGFTAFDGVDRIDVRWDNTLSSQISKYITVGFNAQMLYDRDINAKRQLKQVLSAGLTYTFF